MAKDVCDALGYGETSATLAKHVADEDRQPFNLNTTTNHRAIRGNPRVSVINESGLYALILGSKKPEARAFKKWVTSVVLPAIRKDGAYVMGDKPPHLVRGHHRALQPPRASLIDGGHRIRFD